MNTGIERIVTTGTPAVTMHVGAEHWHTNSGKAGVVIMPIGAVWVVSVTTPRLDQSNIWRNKFSCTNAGLYAQKIKNCGAANHS